MRTSALAGAAVSVFAALVVSSPAASAAEPAGQCPRGAAGAAEWGASWNLHPAADPISGFDRGQLRDLNGDGWICAWTPEGPFDPTSLGPWVVTDNSRPVR